MGCLLRELEKKILKKLFGLGKEKRRGGGWRIFRSDDIHRTYS